MKDTTENDNVIARMVREEGLLSPSPGFTERVMLKIEESRLKTGSYYKPLISRNTWIILFIFLSFVIIFSFAYVPSRNADNAYTKSIAAASEFMAGFHIHKFLDPGTLMLTTWIMASVGLLLILDLILGRYFRPGI